MHRLILASESPRRKELLKTTGFQFQVVSVKVSEIPNKKLKVREQILDIAERKARAGLSMFQAAIGGPFVVLAADTEVILDEGPLGKPSSIKEAEKMITSLAGRKHEVMTAFWLFDTEGKKLSHLETTIVHFKKLNQDQVNAYVALGESYDKAGGYAIQGQGSQLIERIEGDYENVVGLPVKSLIEAIRRGGWEIAKQC